MNLEGHELRKLVAALRRSKGLLRKQDIRRVARVFSKQPTHIRNGDDCAAISDVNGHTLIAAEGMLPSFIQLDPFFAGFCAVMTNVSDIAAMGGRPQAVVDVLFSGGDETKVSAVLEGLAQGAAVFNVPIVGGHTTRSEGQLCLAAAVVGRARNLITSFDAKPGDVVLACIDLRGKYRGDTGNFDAVSTTEPERLRQQLELLPELAEAGVVRAGKDISMAGLPGTLLMLLEMSGCGALIDLAGVPAPAEAQDDPQRWLEAFPSFGYLLAVAPARVREVRDRFEAFGISCGVVAEVKAGSIVDINYQGKSERYWDLEQAPLLGFTPPPSPGGTHA